MGVSLNGGTPKPPQNDQFLVGKPMVVGETHHFRKPPYVWGFVHPSIHPSIHPRRWVECSFIDGSIGGGDANSKVGRLHLVLLGEAPWRPSVWHRTWSPKKCGKRLKYGWKGFQVRCVFFWSGDIHRWRWEFFQIPIRVTMLFVGICNHRSYKGQHKYWIFFWYMDMLPCHDHNEYMNIFVRLRDDLRITMNRICTV